jgi:hypothetical protein
VGADKIGYVMPEGLTVINPDSIGILKGAPNLEVAQRFVTYVLSEEGQKLWMLPVGAEGGPTEYMLGRMCVIPDLFTELADVTVVPINPFEVKSSLDYDPDLGSDRWSLVNDYIGATIIDSHEDLVATWGEIIGAELTLTEAGITSTKVEDAKDKMGEVPLTEEEVLTAAELWRDAEVRNQYISDWHTFALQKYEAASDIAALAGTELLTHVQELESGFESEKEKLESEKEELESGFKSEKEALESQITTLEAEHESEVAALKTQYDTAVEMIRSEKTTNLYTGLGGGLVVGAIVGFAISYFMARQREVAAVQA